jgi:hypothetical protein
MASLYPTALDTNDSLYTAVNGLLTTLTADLSAVATTMSVKSTAGSPATGVVTIKGEAIKYGSKTTTSFTSLTRAYDGTSQAQHFNGDEVDFSPIADHHNAVVQAIQALEAKLGTGTGAVKSGANTLSWGTGAPNIAGVVGDLYIRYDGTPGLSTIYYCTVAGNPATFVAEDNLYVLKTTLTADGDLYYRTGGVVSRLPIGLAGQVLSVSAGLPAWITGAGGSMSNPMTTTGDMIYSTPGSVPVRLPIGVAGQMLSVVGGVPAWAAAVSGIQGNESTAATLTNGGLGGADSFVGALGAQWVSEATASTLAQTGNSSLAITATANSYHHRARAFAPAGAFRVEARVMLPFQDVSGGTAPQQIFGNSAMIGLMVKDSSTSEAALTGVVLDVETNNAGTMIISWYTISAGTATPRGSSQFGGALFNLFGKWLYLRIDRDGANNISVFWSQDRNFWQTLISGVSTAAFTFTAAKLGLRIGSANIALTGLTDFIDVIS